jgi:predicted MFS family arabinose efflux permease
MQDTAVRAPDERATYGGLFRVGEFRALFVAHIVSMLGTMVAEVALTVLVFQRTHSPALSALTFTVGFLPYLVGGALLSGLVDRFPARRTMVLCDLVAAMFFVAMTLPRLPVAALLALDFGAGLVAPIFGGTRAALLPQLLGAGPRYVLGRATMRMVAQGAQVAGFAVGGVLLVTVGARGALLIDAISFALSAVLIRAGIRAHEPVGALPGSSLVGDSLRGVRSVFAHRPVRRLLLLRWLVPTCALAPEALAVPYIHDIGAPQRVVGLYLAMIPASMVAADLVAGRLLGPRAQRRLVVPGALMTTAPLLAFAARPGLIVAMVLLAVIGLGYCHGLALDRLLIATVPESLQARALAVDQAGLMFVQGLGFGAWGGIAELLPLRVTIAVAGACGVAVVVVLVRGLPSNHGRHRGSHAPR